MADLPQTTKSVESNAFRPRPPDSIKQIDESLFEFLRAQSEELRRLQDSVNSGDTKANWELLLQAQDSQLYTLGCLGRFFHPDYGMIHARYVQFTQLKVDGLPGSPFGFCTSATSLKWQVTNRFELSQNDLVVGFGTSSALPTEGQYGWLVVNGINPQEVVSVDELNQFSRIAWGATDRVKNTDELSGPPIAHVFGRGFPEVGGRWILPPASLYVDTLSLQEVSQLSIDFGSVEAKIIELRDSVLAAQQSILQTVAAQSIKIDQTGTALGNLSTRVEGVRGSIIDVNQEVKDQLQIVLNLANAAAVDAGNAGDASQQAFTHVQVTNQFKQSASVSATEAGIFAETATEMANTATLSNSEAGISADAAATSATNAAVSETNAGTSATAAASSAVTAATQATNAATSAAAASTSAGNASSSAGAAASSATSAAGSATSASTSATNAASSATTATTQAGIATTQAGNASTSATAAATSATSATGSATTATTQATNAAASATTATTQAGIATTQAGNASTSATAAATSATTASGSATTATTQATNAASSATTATTQAGIATTQAGNASTSATAAASSATTAAGSSSSASTSATNAANSSSAATLSVAQSLPNNFVNGGEFWGDSFTGPPGTYNLAANPAVTYPAVTGIGKVAEYTNNTGATALDIANKGWVRLVAGRTYRATGAIRNTVLHGTVPVVDIYIVGLDASGGFAGANAPTTVALVLNTWTTASSTWAGTTAIAAGCVYIRALIRFRLTTSTGINTSQWQEITLEDITESSAAATSASAANTSASSASTSASGAAGSASTATTQASNSSVSAGAASTSASAASTSATNASSSASSASSSATLAANLSHGSLLLNPVFANWASTNPDNYIPFNSSAGATKTAGGTYGSPYYIDWNSSTGTTYGLEQSIPRIFPLGYFIVEAEVILVSGSFTGAGIYVQATDFPITVEYQSQTISFVADKDSTNSTPGVGVAGTTYKFSKLIRFTDARIASITVYIIQNSGLFGADTAKHIKWYRVALRPATFEEIRSGVITKATVDTVAAAMIDGSGNAIASWSTTTVAGSATAAIRLQSNTTGSPVSTIALEAQELQVYDGTTRKLAMRIAAGNAQFMGNLNVNGAMDVGGRHIPVALQSFQIQAADGDTVSFGADLTNIPILQFGIGNLVAKTAAQQYSVSATSLTSTGFVMSAKILTPGVTAGVTSSAGAGGFGSGPSWQAQKSDAADAYDGNYTFNFAIDIFMSDRDADTGIRSGYGEVELWVRPSGGSWTSLGSKPVYGSSGSGGTQNFAQSIVGYYAGTIGQHATNTEFGMTNNSGTITAWYSVTYVKQSTSGSSSASPNGEKVTVTVIPQNV